MPFYPFECPTCGDLHDLILPVSGRDEKQICPTCGGTMVRQIAVPAVIGTEKRFQPYFDIGCGVYMKTREQQQREWDSRGLVGLTGRELKSCYERGLSNPTKPYDAKAQEAAWKKAARKAKSKAYDGRKIVITT